MLSNAIVVETCVLDTAGTIARFTLVISVESGPVTIWAIALIVGTVTPVVRLNWAVMITHSNLLLVVTLGGRGRGLVYHPVFRQQNTLLNAKLVPCLALISAQSKAELFQPGDQAWHIRFVFVCHFAVNLFHSPTPIAVEQGHLPDPALRL